MGDIKVGDHVYKVERTPPIYTAAGHRALEQAIRERIATAERGRVYHGDGLTDAAVKSLHDILARAAELNAQSVERASPAKDGGEQDVDDFVAADAFRNTLLPRLDGRDAGGYPWWHGWAISDAYIAGLRAGRTQPLASPMPIPDAVLKAAVNAYKNHAGEMCFYSGMNAALEAANIASQMLAAAPKPEQT